MEPAMPSTISTVPTTTAKARSIPSVPMHPPVLDPGGPVRLAVRA
jgi:hypothetical protein